MVQMICCSGLREADAWSNSTREKGAECQSARASAVVGALRLGYDLHTYMMTIYDIYDDNINIEKRMSV